MRCIKMILFLFVLSLTNLSLSNADSIVLESTFDNDAEGWSIRGDGSDITYHATGGNPYPGGFISAKDWGKESWFFLAPDTWAGDWTSYIGGIISFDLKLISGDTNKYWSAVDVIIETKKSGNYAQWSSGINPRLGNWTTGIWYWDFVASAWTQMTAEVTTGDIAAGDFTGDGKADVASIWSDGLWYQDGATLAWTRIDELPPYRVTAGDVTGK